MSQPRTVCDLHIVDVDVIHRLSYTRRDPCTVQRVVSSFITQLSRPLTEFLDRSELCPWLQRRTNNAHSCHDWLYDCPGCAFQRGQNQSCGLFRLTRYCPAVSEVQG